MMDDQNKRCLWAFSGFIALMVSVDAVFLFLSAVRAV